ncbi:uncharacterized protein [Antedon mediterranea]|uniref:uncharacterized protein n=1 Tax=Antedon mediterranea TaxID=105859 RepID=UPI003AF6394C
MSNMYWIVAVILFSPAQARTLGLKSGMFAIRTKNWRISESTNDQPTGIRCAQACLRLGYDECNHFKIIRCEGGMSGCEIKSKTTDDEVAWDYKIKFQDGAFIKGNG